MYCSFLLPQWGGILFVSRIWDGINDPLVGYLNDRSSSKLGRRKSFFYYSSIPIVLFFALIWLVPNFASSFPIIWSGGFLLLALTGLTMLYVPHYSLSAELSHDPQQRNRIFGIRSIIENIGTFSAVAVISYLGTSRSSLAGEFSQGNMNHKIILAMVIIGVLLLLTVALMVWKVKEPPKQQSANIPFFRSFGQVLKNKSASFVLAVSFFLPVRSNCNYGFITFLC